MKKFNDICWSRQSMYGFARNAILSFANSNNNEWKIKTQNKVLATAEENNTAQTRIVFFSCK